MASLLTTLQVRQVAFEWDATKRIYRASEIAVFDKVDRETIEYSDGTLKHVTKGIWLFFVVTSDYFQRISPDTAAGNDIVDLHNALDDPATAVTFYPIHDVDSSVSVTVLPTADRRDHLRTGAPRKGLFRPSAEIHCRETTRRASLPTWLRTTRNR